MKHYPGLTLGLLLLTATLAWGQAEQKVLFIGNSYTSVNNLPAIIGNMATSTGDELIYDANTPGGFRFLNHATNATTLQKIASEDWDYVVLQEQSQLPAFPEFQKITELYPYAEALVDSIRANNSCSEPMFYMTWGRENGDPLNCENAPWFCTYESMDDSIRATYIHMAEMYNTELSPAGAVWRYLRENHPNLDLYASDGSHPSLAGSYAAGCAFYASIYKKDPTLISWNATLSASDAETIKSAAQTVVYEQLESWDYSLNPAIADFSAELDANTVTFTNLSSESDSVSWYFGDGNVSEEQNPVHIYAETGTFNVGLINYKCGESDTLEQTITINTIVGIREATADNGIRIFPNPAWSRFQVKIDDNYREISLSILAITGREVFYKTGLNGGLPIDISALKPGVYIVKVNAGENIFTERLVKVESK